MGAEGLRPALRRVSIGFLGCLSQLCRFAAVSRQPRLDRPGGGQPRGVSAGVDSCWKLAGSRKRSPAASCEAFPRKEVLLYSGRDLLSSKDAQQGRRLLSAKEVCQAGSRFAPWELSASSTRGPRSQHSWPLAPRPQKLRACATIGLVELRGCVGGSGGTAPSSRCLPGPEGKEAASRLSQANQQRGQAA